MRKSILGAIMTVPLVMGLVSGCGSNPQPAEESQPVEESQPAEESQTPAGLPNESDDFSNVGITAYLPDEYINTVGVVEPISDDISSGDGIYMARLDYIGMTPEQYQEFLDSEDVTDEEIDDYYGKVIPILSFVVIDQNRDADELVRQFSALMGEGLVTKEQLTLVGQAGDCSFYSVEPSAEEQANVENLDGEFRDEYEKLVSLREDVIDNLKFEQVERPVSPSVGKKVSFETVDFDGNTVSSDEIFSQNEITMVNVWATWCHWCVEELGDLEALNQELAGRNCAIIGLCGDAETDDVLETAKELLAENGVTYLNIRPYEGWDETFVMDEGWPTSFFVDKTGTIVGAPVAGAMLQKYQERFDQLLGNEATAGEADTEEAAAGAYDIYVKDQDGNPVKGAMVQFCTDEICKVAPTDADGLASFDDPEGAYEVHILKVPEGYKGTDEVFKTDATYGDMSITIEKE